MAEERTILVTGVDKNMFWMAKEAFESIRDVTAGRMPDLGFIDYGLTPEQHDELKEMDPKIQIIVPEFCWGLDLPSNLRDRWHPKCGSRMFMREYFPGYTIYQWIDFDAWVQDDRFLAVYAEGARKSGIAWAKENEPTYAPTMAERKWWYGNLMLCFGLKDGTRLSIPGPGNNGVLCMHRDAPHWEAWLEQNKRAIARSGKFNMGQHALHAAIYLNNLECTFLSGTYNWICTLAPPVWDQENRILCKNHGPNEPISVLHLAGSDKERVYPLKMKNGGMIDSKLTYASIKTLRGNVVASSLQGESDAMAAVTVKSAATI